MEDLAVETFVAEPRVEALDVAIFPRGSRLDVGSLGTDGLNPFTDLDCDALRAVVRPDIRWRTTQDEQR
jgi:hypothetical protein